MPDRMVNLMTGELPLSETLLQCKNIGLCTNNNDNSVSLKLIIINIFMRPYKCLIGPYHQVPYYHYLGVSNIIWNFFS